MNWYKKAQENYQGTYMDVGHYHTNQGGAVWVSDGTGYNFQREDFGPEEYVEHSGEFSSEELEAKYIGRWDKAKKIISIVRPYLRSGMYNPLPNRLINRLQREFGFDNKIIDFTGKPELVYELV